MAFASTAPRTFSFTFPKFISPSSLWRLLRNALIEARQRQVEHAIGRYLESTGGKLTDEAEREIERRFGWNSRYW
ncbi:MAG: hypothetical protein HY848_21135 [Betaproteobacteria bacterium]|nr:hypothetical protein [Betaproteobacteria bacterium]